jgi:uroporphyrinogen-III synthase
MNYYNRAQKKYYENFMTNQLTVLVTRPDPQGSELCELIKEEGDQPLHLSTIDYAAPKHSALFTQAIADIGKQDWLVFISPRAVQTSIPALRAAWPNLPPNVKFAAVGEGTAQALEAAGYIATYPHAEWGSTGLIELPEFQDIAGKKIAIIRGEGGREILDKTFTARGAIVSHVIAYERIVPVIDVAPYLEMLEQNAINVIIGTSFDGVNHLKLMLGEDAWPLLKKVTLIVVSERIKRLAHDLGFRTIWVAHNASHLSILEKLAQYRKKHDRPITND